MGLIQLNFIETFLICWLTLPADLKIGISKKKIKKLLANITTKLFVFGVIGNHFENYFETALRFGKLCKNYDK